MNAGQRALRHKLGVVRHCIAPIRREVRACEEVLRAVFEHEARLVVRQFLDALAGVYADPPAERPLWFREGKSAVVESNERPEGWGTFDAGSARELMTRPVCMTSNIQSVLFVPDTLDFYVANADAKNEASHTRYTKLNLGELLKPEPEPRAGR